MRGLNLKPSRVYEIATQQLVSGTIVQPPCWYQTIGTIPPSEIMTRTQPVQHRNANPRSKVRKASKLFRPQKIEYPEDRLRKTFFRDHPWELARPRIVLENDGRDGQRCDWSKIQQRTRPLDGESVVQRQLWLMENEGLDRSESYDKARKEFYALRHEEEVEKRVAKEEATWVGGYFGKGFLEIGMELEDKAYEHWKEWATKEMSAIAQQNAGTYTGQEETDLADGAPQEETGTAPLA